jgi:type I restriction enzyme S subunit
LRPGNLHVSGTVEWTEKNTRLLPEKWALEYPSYVIGSNELVMNLTAQSLADQFLGRICLTGANERCLLNQRIARLKPILIEPRFLLWLFKTPLFRRFVDSLNTGSLIQHMFTSQLAEALLPLPPSAEQARLTDAIESAMTRVISIARSAEAACQRIPVERQAILKWAFEGHLVEQDPNDEPASVLLERIKAERASGPAGVGQ